MFLRYHEDLARHAAEWVVDRFAARLPDLSQLTVLVPTGALQPPLRALLQRAATAHGHAGLLGPAIVPLRRWPESRSGVQATPPLSREACELLIHEALNDNPGLVRDDSRWQLTESLLGVFEQLQEVDTRPLDDLGQLCMILQRGYGTPQRLDGPLSREARLVHRLWQAWREQLTAEQRLDPTTTHAEQWRRAISDLGDSEFLLVLQPESLAPVTTELLRELRAAGRAEVMLRGNAGWAGRPVAVTTATALGLAPPPAPAGDDLWIDAALNGDAEILPLPDRAREYGGNSPVMGRWHRVAASNAEDEARVVVLSVIEHLHAHPVDRVVIATENRRLARRIRALLERFAVELADQGGWATSTTRAAAVLERWFECIEQDFDQRPLLDVLQSPFLREGAIFPDEPDRYERAVHHFERDLVRHENVARGLDAYQEALGSRSHRLGTWSRGQRQDVRSLLRTLARAGRPLQRLHERATRPPAGQFLDALARALETLGLDRTLAGDAAGQRVVAVLQRLRAAVADRPARLTWRDFRTWLGRALEQEPFMPRVEDTRVVLADLARAADLPCDCLVLAGLDADHLPGAPAGSPFFNDGVRIELGLSTWEDNRARQLARFRRALGSAPRVIFTHARENNGEPIAASPWLEMLLSFHQLAFGAALDDPSILDRARAFDCSYSRALPPATRRPAPSAPVQLLPERMSASAHGDLIACPYRFFAAAALELEPLEEVREELEKTDYGARLHLALEAFWQPVADMPPPWSGSLDEPSREQAQDHLCRLIEAAFAADLAHRFAHRAWRQRALSLVTPLIDWAIRHAVEHTFDRAEQRVRREVAPGIELRGRLDRVDRRVDGGLAITDYKTGAVAARDDIVAGEDVQLVSYALLVDDVRAVTYLQLDAQRCRSVGLADEELAITASAVEARLLQLWRQLASGAPMPAWNNRLCAYCRYEGLCRRPLWRDDPINSPESGSTAS